MSSYIDAVIPAHEKDIDTVGLCAEYIKKNVDGIRNVYVVSKSRLTDKAEWVSEDIFPFTLTDVSNIIGKHQRTCWYYAGLIQQTSALVIPGLAEHVLICDADTIFTKPKAFVDDKGRSVFNVSYDFEPGCYHNPYLEYQERLVKGLTKQTEYSGIVHHMPVQKGILRSLFDKVESMHDMPFWKASIYVTTEEYKHINRNDHATGQGKMSTYDLYFNFVHKYFREKMVVQPGKSILAYKENFGVEGYHGYDIGSRTNLDGNVSIFSEEEASSFKFDHIADAMRHISNRAGELGWDAITFQNHTRIGVQENFRINDEYIKLHTLTTE